jgi:hypothetical protein
VACQHPLDALDGQEEIGELWRGEVCQAAVGGQRADEDVARQEGLEVDQGEGMRCCEEDLRVFVSGLIYVGLHKRD